MSVTAYSVTRLGDVVTVTATSNATGDPVTFYWYLDGAYVGCGASPTRAFLLTVEDQVIIHAVDSQDPNFDPIAGAPSGYPARRTLWWTCSLSSDVDYYRIEQKKDAGSYQEIGRVFHEAGRWWFSFLSPRLDDLADYTWQITPVDEAGNDGTAVTIGPETIVRTPDAVQFTATFSEVTTRVTFAEAA